jgi:uncharacterized protein YbaP (TraB family)
MRRDEHDQVATRLAPMLAAWSTGNVERLARLVNAEEHDSPIERTLHDMLFTHRNATWATWIRGRLTRPGTVFIAVGAGHLAGRDSVIAMLQREGYRVRRVQ